MMVKMIVMGHDDEDGNKTSKHRQKRGRNNAGEDDDGQDK